MEQVQVSPRKLLKTKIMLKFIAIITLISASLSSSAQSLDYNKERAYFQVNHKGAQAFSTDIKSLEDDFTEDQINSLRESMAGKESIFEIIRIEGNSIRVSYLSGIDLETLKGFIVLVQPNFDFTQTSDYLFD